MLVFQTDKYQRGPYQKDTKNWVHKERIAQGLTQEQAAKRCGVGLRTYQRVEAGGQYTFGVARSTIRKIERALGAKW